VGDGKKRIPPSILDTAVYAAKTGEKLVAKELYSFSDEIGDMARIRVGIDPAQWCKGSVYDLAGEDIRKSRFFLGVHALKQITDKRDISGPEALRELVVIDEVPLVSSEEMRRFERDYIHPLEKFAGHSRVRKRAPIFCGQRLAHFNRILVADAGHLIVFQQPNLLDAGIALNMLGLPEEARKDIHTLPPGVAFVKLKSWTSARKLQMDYIEMGPYPCEK